VCLFLSVRSLSSPYNTFESSLIRVFPYSVSSLSLHLSSSQYSSPALCLLSFSSLPLFPLTLSLFAASLLILLSIISPSSHTHDCAWVLRKQWPFKTNMTKSHLQNIWKMKTRLKLAWNGNSSYLFSKPILLWIMFFCFVFLPCNFELRYCKWTFHWN